MTNISGRVADRGECISLVLEQTCNLQVASSFALMMLLLKNASLKLYKSKRTFGVLGNKDKTEKNPNLDRKKFLI